MGECCLGEFISGGSSENDTDFSNDTDLSAKIQNKVSKKYKHFNFTTPIYQPNIMQIMYILNLIV